MRRLKHERRVVGHVSGTQEHMNECICGHVPWPCPLAGQPVKDYYILRTNGIVYVKEGEFFVSQGGLTQAWGKSWEKISALSTEHARRLGKAMGTGCANAGSAVRPWIGRL